MKPLASGDARRSRVAARFTAFAERWIPDAFVFALLSTVLVLAAAELASPLKGWELIAAWGDGFWKMLEFTLQMSMIIVFGFVVATSAPMTRFIGALASIPRTPRSAALLVTAFSLASAWLNWGFSMVFSAMLAREVARRLRVDYRALAACSFLGLGSIWAQGLSSSAALQMASASMVPAETRAIVATASAGAAVSNGILPLTHTIFLWQSFFCIVVESAVMLGFAWLVTPQGTRIRTALDLGIDLERANRVPADSVPALAPSATPEQGTRAKPTSLSFSERIEQSRWPTAVFVVLAGAYLVQYFHKSASFLSALNIGTVNFALLTLGAALHGSPARLMRATRDATPGIWGVVLQFPFYAAIAAILTKAQLSDHIASFFVSISTQRTFPAVIALYSAFLGIFVPSAGGKWLIEAPYVMRAAHTLHVHLGWMVAVYDLGEALANLLQPFWMLPMLGIFELRARDVMGYTLLAFAVLLPVVLVLVTWCAGTLSYPL